MKTMRLEALLGFLRRHGVVVTIGVAAFLIQLLTLRAPTVLGEPYFIGLNLVKGLGFSYPKLGQELPTITCYIPPLYAWISAAALWLGGGLVTIQVFNLLCFQLGAFVVYRFARHVVTQKLAILSFVGVVFYFPLWILSSAIEPNSLNFLLLALTIETVYLLVQSPTTRRWMFLGFLIGLQLLVRPDIMIGGVLFVIWIILASRKKARVATTLRFMLMSASVALLCVLPWTVRNYVVFHEFVLVSANGGYNLWIGNNASATGEFALKTWTDESLGQLQSVERYAIDHDVPGYDKMFQQFGIDWILRHPVQTFMLDLKKIYYHWWRRSDVGGWYNMDDLQIYFAVTSAILLLFGFLGLLQLKNKEAQSLLITLFFYSTAVAAIFFVQSRHRVLKVDPYLIVLSVAGAYQLFWGRRRLPMETARPQVLPVNVSRVAPVVQIVEVGS